MNNTAILVTTFLRDDCLFRCINSIRKYYPDIPIYVGDNGDPTQEKRDFCSKHQCKLLELPFDLGVAGVRNESLKLIPEKYEYIIICEDDIVFTKNTDLDKWYQILQEDPEIGIVGGLLRRGNGAEQHYEANTWIENGTHYIEKIQNPDWKTTGNVKYFLCDLILNVFMMKRKVWKDCQWDAQFKTAFEHSDFFLRIKYDTQWKVAYTPDMWMYHKDGIQTGRYNSFRKRPVGWQLFGKKWNVKFSVSSFNAKNPVSFEERDRLMHNMGQGAKDDVLRLAIKILETHKIKWWLHCGTCLGAIREKSYIKWDTDIDLGIAPGRGKIWEKLKSEFLANNFALYKEWNYRDQVLELSFEKYGVKIDLFFFRKKKGGDRLWYGVFGPDKLGRWGEFMEFLPHSVPAELFENLKKIKFRGMRCFVPSPPEKFLTELYGKDWKTPKRNYRYWEDSKAIDKSLIDRPIEVFIFDAWDSIGDKERRLLREAKKLGNKLTVGILTDSALEGANIPFKHPFNKRLERLEKLRIINKVMTINSVAFARDLQKIGYIPDYFIAFKGENFSSVEYLKTFGSKIVSVEDIVRTARKRNPPKKRGNKIAIGIKTFLREGNFFRTVEAIERKFPFPYKLYIADDGGISDDKQALYERLETEGHKVIRLPHNVGISSGRNATLAAVKEDYVLIMDDDIQINDPQTIIKMKRVLDSDDNIGIVAGVLKHEYSDKTFGNDNYSRGIDLEIKDGVLHRYSTRNAVEEIADIRCRQSDQVVNFFLAKREVFDSVRWDSQIKVEYEHMDFFLGLKKTAWKAIICLDAVATHLYPSLNDMEYVRYRRSAPVEYFAKKHGIAPKPINHWATEGKICQIER